MPPDGQFMYDSKFMFLLPIAVLGALGMFCGFYLTVFLISCVLCLKDYGEGSVDEDRRPIISSIEMPDSSKIFF